MDQPQIPAHSRVETTPPPINHVVAPPSLAPPPLESNAAPPVVVAATGASSGIRRALRDLIVGASCLVVGLIVGQSPLVKPQAAQTTTLVFPMVEKALVSPPDESVPQPSMNETITNEVVNSETITSEMVTADQAPVMVAEFDEPKIASLAVQPALVQQLPQRSPESHDGTAASNWDHCSTIDLNPSVDANATDESPSVAQVVPSTPAVEPPRATAKPIKSLVSLTAPTIVHPTCVDGDCPSMQSLETELLWADSPADAYKLAAQEDKLVFLIHVSGNFEIPGFT